MEGMKGKYEVSFVKTPLLNRSETRIVPEILRHWSQAKPEEEAYVFLSNDGGREVVTWGALYENSVKCAKAFITLGIKERDVVGISLPNCPAWLYVAFGATFMRAIPFGIDFRYKDGSDVVEQLNKIEACSTFVLDTDNGSIPWTIFKTFLSSYSKDGRVESSVIPSLRFVLSASAQSNSSGVLTVQDILRYPTNNVELPAPVLTDVIVLLQTSGSTGKPKLVPHTHNSFSPLFLCLDMLSGYSSEEGSPRSKEIIYNDMPFSWFGGDHLSTSLLGRTRILRSGVSKTESSNALFIIDAVKKERCTVLSALPPTIRLIMDAVAEQVGCCLQQLILYTVNSLNCKFR